MIENKKYFISQINSSKAYQFTSQYHYSHIGFKKAQVNLGIFNKETKELVGVLQWGHSGQEKIRLNRYVKEPIKLNEYLELNRFCMADSEEKNSESQAISLGIKWLRQNRPDIRLLVSYAGRKEGNYGYIYQAANWEYLGYFVSSGFWEIDGQERHSLTLWYHYNKYGDKSKGFNEGICDLYNNVKQTFTKQFIYIQRLDKSLTPASELLPYPKPSNEFPILVEEKVYKTSPVTQTEKMKADYKKYYYEEDEQLFSRRTLIRRGDIKPSQYIYLIYDIAGHFEGKYNSIQEIQIPEYKYSGLAAAYRENKKYKDKYFIKQPIEEEILEEIEVPSVAEYDNITFYTISELVKYTNLSRQAIHAARQRKAKTLANKPIIWLE